MHKPPLEEFLMHIGVKRRSGRYPWGSGEEAYQHAKGFNQTYKKFKMKGLSDTEIAKEMGMNSTEFRHQRQIFKNIREEYEKTKARELNEKGMNNTEIAKQIGVSEGSIRGWLSEKTTQQTTRQQQFENIMDTIRSSVERTGYLDVSKTIEIQMGISREKFKAAYKEFARREGYHIHKAYIPRLSTTDTKQKVKYTTITVLTKNPDPVDTKKNSHLIMDLNHWSDDKSLTVSPHYVPHDVDLKRVHIRYAEDGGVGKDGLIELRRGVEDLDLGRSRYAQVRIRTGDNLYMKGMVAYSDDKFPSGKDIIFNTNKKRGTPVEKVLKPLKMDAEKAKGDPSFMFGSSVTKQKGALNIVNEEGKWGDWGKTMSSQFLSKQPTNLIKERLDETYEGVKKEFDTISSYTNPLVRKYLLESASTGFINQLAGKARKLKAKSLANTGVHVLLPFPNMNANEVYAPNYDNGTRVALVRHPHGGKFEIPDLIVNNKNPKAEKMIGPNAPDAIGIHPSVAQKLSGADFDGDTVLVIPNQQGKIKTDRSLKELTNFDHIEQYRLPEDSPKNFHYTDQKTGAKINSGKTIADDYMQTQMGMVSNLITDMTIKGATAPEIARAVKHSMVIIDSLKHNLDWRESARQTGYHALQKKYQTEVDPKTGKRSKPKASTLISKSKRFVDITDPNFDPDKLSSGTAQEEIYSKYIKNLQHTRNEAIKLKDSIVIPPRDAQAAKKYKAEIESLDKKLNTALLNKPKERQAQILTEKLYRDGLIPGMTKDERKKLKARALASARITVGAKRSDVQITPKEWEAIQANAVSKSKLLSILQNADMEIVKRLATPRERLLDDAKISRANMLLAKGYTIAEVAENLGVSSSTLKKELNNE